MSVSQPLANTSAQYAPEIELSTASTPIELLPWARVSLTGGSILRQCLRYGPERRARPHCRCKRGQSDPSACASKHARSASPAARVFHQQPRSKRRRPTKPNERRLVCPPQLRSSAVLVQLRRTRLDRRVAMAGASTFSQNHPRLARPPTLPVKDHALAGRATTVAVETRTRAVDAACWSCKATRHHPPLVDCSPAVP